MTFTADYPGAIVVEAAQYGYSTKNKPVGFVYHTPEEDADDDPQTPGYLAGTTRQASYTYFVSFLGFIFQLVPESEGAYANGIVDKGYPSWANPAINLNLQGISVSFEGHAATIHQTMLRGGPQWRAGVDLVAHRAKALSISPDNWTRHKDVYTQRGDTGSLDISAFTRDVKTKMGGTMFDAAEKDYLGSLARGIIWAVTNATMNTAVKRGNPDWKPPRSQRTLKIMQNDMKKMLTEIRGSLRGGDLPGLWWKVKGKGTIYYVELVGGVLVRHHARNPQSYTNLGGDWKVKEVTQAQMDVTIAGPRLPDLKV